MVIPFPLLALEYFIASSLSTATTLSGKWSVKKSGVTSNPRCMSCLAVTQRASGK